MSEQETETLLAFDVGTQRTGVAVGQTLSRSAQPAGLLAVRNGRPDWSALEKLLSEWQPAACVLGEPHSESAQLNKVINRLEHYLRSEHKLPVYRVDERLTSAAASAELQGANLSVTDKTRLRDQLAACLILDSYFRDSDH